MVRAGGRDGASSSVFNQRDGDRCDLILALSRVKVRALIVYLCFLGCFFPPVTTPFKGFLPPLSNPPSAGFAPMTTVSANLGAGGGGGGGGGVRGGVGGG